MWIASAWIVAAAALCGIRAADASSSPYESPSSRPELELPIVAAGRPVARVLVAGEDETLEAAVSDFTQYVERISSARLEVARGTADLPGPTLHVGETELYERTADAREAVRVDGFALAKSGEDLIVAGRIPQGTANGLWTILQDRLGVRWYHAGPLWEVVPRQESLSIRFRPNAGSAARVENPSFLGRFYWGAAPSAAFARRSRLTQKGTPLPYVSTGHALDRVVPLEEYAAAHPEYFALIDGRRVTDRVSHPCFTHPDMLDVFMKYVRAGGTTFGVNDNLDACHCERCLAVDGASERYLGMWNFSESYFQLMARVARQTAEEFPGRRLGVFAYQLTNAPPRTVDPIGENIDVVLCQDTSQHFDPRVRAMDQRMAAEWTRKAGGVSLYDYYGIDYWTPRCFPGLLAGQLKHLAACGVKGYLSHATTMIDSSMPMFYLYGRLLWDADLDPRQVIDEMLEDLYGEAAEPMRRFYDHWEQCWMRQAQGKWFRGMDDFRAEMAITPWEDIAKGQELLEEALSLARADIVKQRLEWIRSSFAFTRAAAWAHEASMRAIRSPPAASAAEARELSAGVVEAWQAFAEQLERSEKNPFTSASGWHPKTFRVRAWALKQQMRDGALAPLVRWAAANEARIEPDAFRAAERGLWQAATRHRAAIEALVTETVGAVMRRPRAAPLRPADIPRVAVEPAIDAGAEAWSFAQRVDALEWVYRERDPSASIGKYDEPMPQEYVDPPPPADHSAQWQAAWSERKLFLRIEVTDDTHRQGQDPPGFQKEDCVQVHLNPHRERFDDYDEHSWYFLMGDYRRRMPGFTVALRGENAGIHVATPPPLAEGVDAASLIECRAARRGERTVYEIAIDWRWLEGFEPRPERSFGITLVVVDDDGDGRRQTAEYGDGIFPRRRPTEFAALRLVKDSPRRRHRQRLDQSISGCGLE